MHGFVGVTFLNDGFTELALSWLCNAEPFGSHRYVLFIATDEAAFGKLDRWRRERNWSFAVALLPVDDALRDSFHIDEAGYWTFLRGRVRFLEQLVAAAVDFLLFETDAVWFRCAFEEQRHASASVDIFGIQDGSQSTAIGFGFLVVRSNARVQALWRELTRRFDAAVAPLVELAPHTVIAAQPQSEQHILSLLVSARFADVVFEFLPSALYVGGKWYQQEHVRHAVSSAPVLINLNWMSGVAAKKTTAIAWRHWFVGDAGECVASAVERLPETTLTEPRRRFDRAALHWHGCPCTDFVGGSCWCRCCSNNAGGYRADCVRAGFCAAHCTGGGGEWCRNANLSFVEEPSRERCFNRYLFVQRDDLRAENLRDAIARAARTLTLARALDLTAVVQLPSLTQHLLESACVMTLREVLDLHPMATKWQNVVFHGLTRRAACRDSRECFVRSLSGVDIVLSDGGDGGTLLAHLQRVIEQHDPVLLVVHDAHVDHSLAHSGLDRGLVQRTLAELEPALLLHEELARQRA